MNAETLSEEELVERSQSGEREAVGALLDDTGPMVEALARRLTRQRATREDLVHEGFVGVLHAIDRFDPDRGTRFSTYARYWVRYYLQRFSRRNRRIVTAPRSRNMVKARNGARRVRRELEQERGGPVGDEAVADALGVDVEDVAHVRMEYGAADVSIHVRGPDDRGVPIAGEVPDPEQRVSALETQRLRHALIDDAVCALDDRERLIVREHILSEEPRTLREIGEDLGISRERVRQLEKRALRKMRESMEAQPTELVRAAQA